MSLTAFFSLICKELSWYTKSKWKKIFQDGECGEISFLLSSDRFWKSHTLGIDAQRPSGELLHWGLHGPLLTHLFTAECFWCTAHASIAAGSTWPALRVALHNLWEGKFCYQKLQTALLETSFFLRGLSSFNCISGFVEHFTDFCVILVWGARSSQCCANFMLLALWEEENFKNKRIKI